jgi:serine protease Do
MLRYLATLWLVLFSLEPAWAQTDPKPELDPLHRVSEAVESLTARVAPSVVKILVTGYGPVSDNGRMETALIGRQRSIGSGVILDPNGYIVTNAHVVNGAQRVRVAMYSGVGGKSLLQLATGEHSRILDARIIGVDKITDLAVLKVEAKNLPALAIGSYAKLRQGQMVLAFGTPEGLENTVTMGVVSSVLRQLDPDESMVYIQTDAAINPGNSGGPLVDVDGNLVGINSAIYSESGGNEGIGFAIPSVIVQHVYRQIKRFGHVHRYEIGARMQTISPSLAGGLKLPRDHGVIVADVEPEGPADNAGLRVADILVTLNGSPVDSLPMFAASLYLRGSGEPVKIEVLRDGKPVSLTIPVVERDQELDSIIGSINPETSLVRRLGIVGVEIDSKLASALAGLRVKTGVVVAAKAAGPSVDSGIETADVIHRVNTTDIASLDGLRAVLDVLKPGDPVVLQVERSGTLRYLAFDWE